MLKEKAQLYDNYDCFHHKCQVCKKKNHLITICPSVHHIPDKDFLLKKFNHSDPQTRMPHIRLNSKKLNARKKIRLIQIKAMKIFYQTIDDKESPLENPVFEDFSESSNEKIFKLNKKQRINELEKMKKKSEQAIKHLEEENEAELLKESPNYKNKNV